MGDKIANKKVVKIDYELKDKSGNVLDASEKGQPLVYLHGSGNIIEGLEDALAGKQVGDHVNVVIPADKAYGERDDDLIQKVPRGQFPAAEKIEVGMQFVAQGEEGDFSVTVTAVDALHVTVDGNHPLAGEELHFSVDVVSIRDAAQEELDHGHAHEGGHHHH